MEIRETTLIEWETKSSISKEYVVAEIVLFLSDNMVATDEWEFSGSNAIRIKNGSAIAKPLSEFINALLPKLSLCNLEHGHDVCIRAVSSCFDRASASDPVVVINRLPKIIDFTLLTYIHLRKMCAGRFWFFSSTNMYDYAPSSSDRVVYIGFELEDDAAIFNLTRDSEQLISLELTKICMKSLDTDSKITDSTIASNAGAISWNTVNPNLSQNVVLVGSGGGIGIGIGSGSGSGAFGAGVLSTNYTV